jgi:hypothetical protein
MNGIYGLHICPICQLTVAEYINGGPLQLTDGMVIYVHFECKIYAEDSAHFHWIHGYIILIIATATNLAASAPSLSHTMSMEHTMPRK